MEAVKSMYDGGMTGRQIAAELGVTPPTVSYYLRKLGIAPQQQRRHDWAVVQQHYDAGHSVRECLEHFRMSSETWNRARQRGAIVTRPAAMTVEQLLGGRRNRTHLKERLIRAGLKSGHCESCGLRSWMGEPLSLSLHHVNGDGDDNRLENLELLCPNCHSQTENFAGRNRPPTAA